MDGWCCIVLKKYGCKEKDKKGLRVEQNVNLSWGKPRLNSNSHSAEEEEEEEEEEVEEEEEEEEGGGGGGGGGGGWGGGGEEEEFYLPGTAPS